MDGAFGVSNISADGKFQIDVNTGIITVYGALDYEALPTNQKYYDELVYVTDDQPSGARQSSATVRINVNDQNDAPVLNAATYSVNEQATGGPQAPVITLTYNDVDTIPTNKNLVFAITGGDSNGYWGINNLGKLWLQKDLNYEALYPYNTTFNLTVDVWDGGAVGVGLHDSKQITVNVTNVDEIPTAGYTLGITNS